MGKYDEDTALTVPQWCPHLTLIHWRAVNAAETMYMCSTCKRKIAVPDITITRRDYADFAHIIGMTFGAAWEKRAFMDRQKFLAPAKDGDA